MTTNKDLESRLRGHFSQLVYRPRPEWERTVLNRAGTPSSPLLRIRTRLLLLATATIVAFALVITALPAAAGPDLPSWALGLRSTVGVDAAGGSRATSWGSTMELVGAYLDAQHTIVVLKGSQPSMTAIPNAYLEAMGQRYEMQQVVSWGDGYYAIKFSPFHPSLVSPVAVRLHLADGPGLPPHVWTLSFRISPSPKEAYPLPVVRAGDVTIAFTSVDVVPGAVAFQFTEMGVAYDEVLGPFHTGASNSNHVQSAGRGPVVVHVQVFDNAGAPLQWLDMGLTPTGGPQGPAHFSEVFLRTGPAPYRIVITSPSGQAAVEFRAS